MAFLRRLLQDLRRLGVLLPARRPVSLGHMPPTVSFTFDDFPASAARIGAPILEDSGCRGTFYLSAGLLGADSPHGPVVDPDDILRLAERGHEIGCHGFGHLRAEQVDAESFARDLDKNRAAVAQLAGGLNTTSFAFPYGSVTSGAKRAAAGRYAASRTTMPRLNRGAADMNLLSAVPLYSREGFPERAMRLLEDCGTGGGWLILYTHDVQAEPSPSGCTPDSLRAFVRAALDLGCRAVPVRQAAELALAGPEQTGGGAS